MDDADVSRDALRLAPLTRGGNYAFRRLCEVDFGARVTVSERWRSRGFWEREIASSRATSTRARTRDGERTFGAQIATNAIGEGVRAGLIASGEFGADFVDLNCGCPIHEDVEARLGRGAVGKAGHWSGWWRASRTG